ncbi:MAG: DUF4286 family protein [Formosa sp.]|jgi:hypothetical protein|nr:DUF4286 family protein [Formosa sp.]MDC0382182.1 DUF4286 family protein [Flavobacteriaceae bacterium]MDC0462913.1 DUF4286 family protein [Flavobacteriaceae bacterium]|tara:strand:+ start:104 stop:427 length:324 start_codon:yes stop_codon:yes gene_type:complete
MIIYNVTANIDDSIHEKWLAWIKTHIPKVLSTGLFLKATFTKVLVEESMGGLTYSIQYLAPSKEALESYYKVHASIFHAEESRLFADKMLVFKTELEWIDEYTVTQL